jgi:RND family efflux transporter MFP subunit
MPNQFQKLSLAVCLGFASFVFAGCGKNKNQQQQQKPAPVVTVAPVEHQEIVEWEEFTGHTAAIENVEVRPRVSGHIQAVKFQSGQLVKKVDVLFQIDPRWHQATFDQRAAEYEQAKVKLAIAERESKRTTQLLANKAISVEEAEQRESRFQEAKAALLAAKAAQETAELDLEYTTIRSPIDGKVSRALVTEGNYVTAGNGTVLTTIVSVDPIHVYADIDENTLLKFNALAHSNKIEKDGGKIPVELELADESNFPHHGYIESFDNKLDPNSGSILLRAVFPNPKGRIVPGLFARIRIPASEKYEAILIDDSAISTDQAQKFSLALTPSNTVEYRALKLGPIVNGKRIVRDGLKPGDQIVVNGLQRVRPGMPVQAQIAKTVVTNSVTETAQK